MNFIDFENVSFSYPPVEGDLDENGKQIVPSPVFEHFSGGFPGAFTSIIGPNGCGKSTLIKMAAGIEEPDEGTIEIGETIKIGYLAQEEHHMPSDQRVIDYIKDIGEYVQTKEGKITASQMLERFLFTPDMQYTPISKLSGGEKRRLPPRKSAGGVQGGTGTVS